MDYSYIRNSALEDLNREEREYTRLIMDLPSILEKAEERTAWVIDTNVRNLPHYPGSPLLGFLGFTGAYPGNHESVEHYFRRIFNQDKMLGRFSLSVVDKCVEAYRKPIILSFGAEQIDPIEETLTLFLPSLSNNPPVRRAVLIPAYSLSLVDFDVATSDSSLPPQSSDEMLPHHVYFVDSRKPIDLVHFRPTIVIDDSIDNRFWRYAV